MRIAVASEGLCVSPLFSCCSSFTFYKIRHGVITECQNMPNPLLPAHQLAPLFQELEVGVLIAGCIDDYASSMLSKYDIEIITNASGTAQEATKNYLARTLAGADEDDATALLEAQA